MQRHCLVVSSNAIAWSQGLSAQQQIKNKVSLIRVLRNDLGARGLVTPVCMASCQSLKGWRKVKNASLEVSPRAEAAGISAQSVPPIARSVVSSGSVVNGVVVPLVMASAMAVGANWVDVRNGVMTPERAVLNGVAKGTAASLILQVLSRRTSVQLALATAALAGAGYLIDSAMKGDRAKLGSAVTQV